MANDHTSAASEWPTWVILVIGFCVVIVGTALFVLLLGVLRYFLFELFAVVEHFGGPSVATQKDWALGAFIVSVAVAPWFLEEDPEERPRSREERREANRRAAQDLPVPRTSSASTAVQPARTAEIVITDRQPRRSVTPADFADLHSGDHRPLVETVAASRLRDFETGTKLPSHNWKERIFGVRSNAVTRTRAVLEEMTSVIKDAATYLEAVNDFTTTKIKIATSQKRYDLENMRLDNRIAAEASGKAKYESHRAEYERSTQQAQGDAARPTRASQKRNPRTKGRSRSEVATAPRVTRSHSDHVTQAHLELERELKLERLKKQIQAERHEQLIAEERLARRLAGVKDPDAARQRRAESKRDQEKQRITEGLRAFTDDADRKAYARRELDAYVQRVAEEHGQDSDEHQAAIDHAEDFMRSLADGEDA